MFAVAVVATMGPAINSEEGVSNLLDAGLTAVRFKLSCDSCLSTHVKAAEMVHRVATKKGKFCAIILDVSGTVCEVRLAGSVHLHQQGSALFNKPVDTW